MTPPAHKDAAAAKELPWPAPPYFEFVREKDGSAWADCVLSFRDGTKASGRLHNFVADAARLTFHPNGAREPVNIPFSVAAEVAASAAPGAEARNAAGDRDRS